MQPIRYIAKALISPDDIGFDGPTSDTGLLTTILNAVYFWGAAVAIIVIIIAGFYYIVADGDSAQIVKAKNAILGAVIGLVVIILAFSITLIVTGALVAK